MRLDGAEETAAALDGQSRIAPWLDSRRPEEASTLRQRFRETGDPEAARVRDSERGLRDRIPALNQERPFRRTVYSSALRNAARRLSRAIREHQKGATGRAGP